MAQRFWPMRRGHVVTSPYGPRDDGFHWGTDFGRPGGSGGLPVYATQGGTAVMVGPATGFGQWVVLDHPTADGSGTTVYGHVVPEVALGQHVTAGQRIAHINHDSRTNGGVPPHLHLEVHRSQWSPPGGNRLDPVPWLAGACYPDEPATTGDTAMHRGLDFAGGRPGAAAIRAAGYSFVVRYLSPGGPSLPGKQLLPGEADDYRAHGIDIVSNWETFADRMLGGYTAGTEDATTALAQVLACGGPRDRPIYFSADWDASEAEQTAIDAYLRGAAAVVGRDCVGVYGGYWVVKRCLDNGTARWAWQAEAWSGGNIDPRAHIIQRNTAGYAYVGGIQCDRNDATTTNYGQWSLAGTEETMAVADDELGKRYPSRSIYRTTDAPVDTLAGLVSNIDARIHEAFVADQAAAGVPGYRELVEHVAAVGIYGDTVGFGYPSLVEDSKARARVVLDSITKGGE